LQILVNGIYPVNSIWGVLLVGFWSFFIVFFYFFLTPSSAVTVVYPLQAMVI